MAVTFKTPGVYIKEENAFPNAVVAVETAIPAFVGYTQQNTFDGQNLQNTPVQVTSMLEFETYFGGAPKTTYTLAENDPKADPPVDPDFFIGTQGYNLTADAGTNFLLHTCMKWFFQNGGGTCYIVSVGTYGGTAVTPDFSLDPYNAGIAALEKAMEPTMLVIPDAVLFDAVQDDVKGANCYSLQGAMIDHCGKMKNRVAILDVFDGFLADGPTVTPIETFRNQVNSDFLDYSAAYYPWMNTTVIQAPEVSYQNVNSASIKVLQGICTNFITANKLSDTLNTYVTAMASSSAPAADGDKPAADGDKPAPADKGKPAAAAPTPDEINTVLNTAIADYKTVMGVILEKLNLLPPSAAMAGVYTSVDDTRGVWKAPANVAMASVVSPSVIIDDGMQADLNAPLFGKAVNAIRSFTGEGILVWGARTMDANSLDWRYISVRRTMIMLEQSVKFAAKAYVFEPNVKNTWVSVQSMIENFLTNVWKQGALAGSKPADAFSVAVGLGATMTAVDILEGIMRIQVKVAVSRPAEFIEITFEQQMQKS
ncbi:phage tail sheath family protein [bacterium SCSIO 12741]|nr:phage tail sheath family protein [bacterium SCSIO 12741]